MTDKLHDVWTTRDFPVLVEVARLIDGGATTVRVEEVADAIGLSRDEVQRAGAALKRRGLVDAFGSTQSEVLRFRNLSGEAYLLTGLHPGGDDAVSDLIALLRQAADQVDDPEEKSRLRRLADNAGGVSRDVLAGVLTALAISVTG